jgi:uroporphyrinogen-III synthase
MDLRAGPLRGRRVVTTRDRPGELDRLLAEAGAEVVHVPLIEIVDASDGGSALAAAFDPPVDWVVVTSRHGAARVGPTVAGRPEVRLAAVGTSTAAELARLAGRAVDVVPERQTGGDLLRAMPVEGSGQVVVLAQADRADSTLADGLTALGYRVRSVTAYRTLLRTPSESERASALAADAVAFASGSAAHAWADAIGTETPARVIAIGPATAEAATSRGLTVTEVAARHDVTGLVLAVAEALHRPGT